MSDNNRDAELFSFAEFDETMSEHIAAPRYSYWKSVWRTFFKDKIAIGFSIILIIVISFALIQPMFSNYSPVVAPYINTPSMKFLKPFVQGYIFGTDNIGNSVFDAVWAGARNSIIISFICTAINMIIGIPIGAVWGFSKKIDKWMIEVYNIISNVPFLLLAMILVYVLGAGFNSLIFTMTCTEWIFIAYFIRTQVMIIRDREYSLASRCLGTPTHRVIGKNILPFMTSVIVTVLATELPSYISMEVFLSFIGIGLSASVPSLGRMIQQSQSAFLTYPWEFWAPVAISALITVILYVLGQNLADASDPRTHMM